MPNPPQSESILKDPVTWLYPAIEPYSTGRLPVSPVHEIYFEESGNPSGKPVIFLHGGLSANSWTAEPATAVITVDSTPLNGLPTLKEACDAWLKSKEPLNLANSTMKNS
jgi:hypothetical protein